jgi:predicted PolB exonuclease-like 3'-5' exonuclease
MQFKIDKLLFFDIETVSQYKDLYDMPEDKLKMWESYYDSFRKKVTDESRIDGEVMTLGEIHQEVYRQTAAFFPEFGKVACVSMAFVTKTGEIRFESFYGEDELHVLTETRKVFDKIEPLGFDLCGQSIKNFDIPFLGKRFFINGMKPPKLFPTYDTKPWDLRVVDTKDVWQFGNNWSLGSLDLICSVLDIDSPKNGDVKGDSVTTNYWEGKHEEIKEYCERDVKALVDIITKLNNLK